MGIFTSMFKLFVEGFRWRFTEAVYVVRDLSEDYARKDKELIIFKTIEGALEYIQSAKPSCFKRFNLLIPENTHHSVFVRVPKYCRLTRLGDIGKNVWLKMSEHWMWWSGVDDKHISSFMIFTE